MRISARNQLRATVSRGASIANVELDVAGRRVVASITVEAVDEVKI
jgi:molybdopterin-binding protein